MTDLEKLKVARNAARDAYDAAAIAALDVAYAAYDAAAIAAIDAYLAANKAYNAALAAQEQETDR
jgi:hypothetical protein